MFLLAAAGAVFHQIKQRYQRQRSDAPPTVADATPFEGRVKDDLVTYDSTAAEEEKPQTPLGL